MNINSKKKLDKLLKLEIGNDYNSFSNRFYYRLVPSCKSFIKTLRYAEFYSRKRNIIEKLKFYYYKIYLNRLSVITGISIPINICEEGLTIYHYGSIVVNGACRIGRNCCICNNVNIGATGGSMKAPQIGNNVFIGHGAVIFGEISIADNCYIGANTVICKSITEPNSVVVGAPGRTIKYDNIVWWEKNNLNRNK